MTNILVLKSLEDVKHSIRNPVDEADVVVIDWLDLEDAEVQVSLKKLFFERRRMWTSVEIRKCIGHCMPLLIQWVLEASANAPIQTFSLVSVFDEDISIAIRRSLLHVEARPNFNELEISGSHLSCYSLKLLFEGLCRDSCHTEAISFSNSNFLQHSHTSLAEGLAKCPCVLKLNLFSCRMADEQVAEVVNTLRTHRHPLKHLDLGKNRCLALSMEALGKWIAAQGVQLEHLNLSLQHLGFHMIHLDPSPIFWSLARNTTLKSLYLRGNPMDSGDGACFRSLSQSLTKNDSLERLMLTDCFLSNKAYESIFQSVSDFKGLRKLWLDGIQRYSARSANPQLPKMVSEGLRRNSNVILDEMHLPLRLDDLTLEIDVFMDRNFGGRRLLVQEEGSIEILPALWPQVLERVNLSDLPRRSIRKHDVDKAREDCVRRSDIIYFMLRENSSLQNLMSRY